MAVTAELGVTPRQGMIASLVTANASGSSTTTGVLNKAHFDWGDGTSDDIVPYLVTTPLRGNQISDRQWIATHKYAGTGTPNGPGAAYWQYTVTVTMYDDQGNTNTATFNIKLRLMNWDLTISSGDPAAAINALSGNGSDGLPGKRVKVNPGSYNCGAEISPQTSGTVIWCDAAGASWDPNTGHLTLTGQATFNGQFIQGRGIANYNLVDDINLHGILFTGYCGGQTGNVLPGNGANGTGSTQDGRAEDGAIFLWNNTFGGTPSDTGGQYDLVEYCTTGPNRACGIAVQGKFAVVQYCASVFNDCMGTSPHGYRVVYQFCEVHNNNPRGYYPASWTGGGNKANSSRGSTWRWCRYEANQNCAIWWDGPNDEGVVEDCWLLTSTPGNGAVFAEIMDGNGPNTTHGGLYTTPNPRFGVKIRRNFMVDNYHHVQFAWSGHGEVYHNIIDSKTQGYYSLKFQCTVRTDGGEAIGNISITDNWVRLWNWQSAWGFENNGGWGGGKMQTVPQGLVIDYNLFFVQFTGSQMFSLFSTSAITVPVTFPQWQAGNAQNPGGFDVHSQMTTNMANFPTVVPIVGAAPPPQPTVPVVIIGVLSNVLKTSATVNMTIDPGSNDATWQLTATDPNNTVVFTANGSFLGNTGPHNTSANITGLQPGTTYQLLLTASSSAGAALPFQAQLRRRQPRWVLVSRSVVPK